MIESTAYRTEQDAARALLKDATAILNESGVEFAVVGGWVPYLFHRDRYGHPGTFDVDLLLHPSSLLDGTFDRAAESLLERGYLRAVKNRFQAHRILRVGDENLVFHVDFLNETNQGEQMSLVGGRARLQSIYTPAMEVVFKYGAYRQHPDFPGLNFPSVETFLASKAAGTLVTKRPRDAFDAFITALDQDPTALRNRWQELMADGLFQEANGAFLEGLDQRDAVPKIQFQIETLGKTAPSHGQIRDAFSFLIR